MDMFLQFLCIPFLLILLKHAIAPPQERDLANKKKIPLELDIVEKPASRITATPSRKHPNGTHYSVKSASRHTHIIGDVTECTAVILPGNPRHMSRFVLVVPREDGSKYVRVVTRKRDDGRYVNKIKEFVKKPDYEWYARIKRDQVEIELLTQKNDNIICVEKDPETGVETFTVRPEMSDHVTIGTVEYSGFVVNQSVSGLMSRKVTLEKGDNCCYVGIESYYVDCVSYVLKYKINFADLEYPILVESRKKMMEFLE
ncbi:signal peptide-containing protein [Theileria equi strain WA]|uniref:Signal peptide-containing protein n=1 Tax=Theileria equi strain WA TaxID=1537102 RepID=L0AZV0_THEEQ|nr:signal peptide-containing protein [Theileria equi strain WA]AFZ80788.1 signal peptide-containing protein [Theileria equi strain WA]|eukprot:XP_004830454.1 signal peptide-containing protein [Theileria equi strain WA]